MTNREAIVERILAERVRQFDLPGTEYDVSCSPNDWIATIVRLASEGSNSRGRNSDAVSFEEALIKCAAVSWQHWNTSI
jgi:hypothetical protein